MIHNQKDRHNLDCLLLNSYKAFDHVVVKPPPELERADELALTTLLFVVDTILKLAFAK